MSGLTGKEISTLLEKFPHMHSSFDTNTLVNEFIFSSTKKLVCLICKKEFNSPFEIADSIECKGDVYHPKNIVNLKDGKAVCTHEGCQRKLNKLEFPCCHKVNTTAGCILGEGRHMIVIAD